MEREERKVSKYMILSNNTKRLIRAWDPNYKDLLSRDKLDIYKFTREDRDIHLSIDPKKFYIFFWSEAKGVIKSKDVPGLEAKLVAKNRANYKKATSGEIYISHKIYFNNYTKWDEKKWEKSTTP